MILIYTWGVNCRGCKNPIMGFALESRTRNDENFYRHIDCRPPSYPKTEEEPDEHLD